MKTSKSNSGSDKSISKHRAIRNKLADPAQEGQFDEMAAYGNLRRRVFNKKLEDYVFKHEAKLIEDIKKKLKKEKREKEANLLAEEKVRLKELHYMKCPQCGMNLHEVKLMKTMVWACEECLGIWLKQGKIKNIIKEKSSFMCDLCETTGLTKLIHLLKGEGE